MTIFIGSILFVVIMLIYSALHHDLKAYHGYAIKKGKHYCDATVQRLLLHNRSRLVFQAMFGKGCYYTLDNKDDQWDINKLYGLGWGFKGPTHNSIRIGWRYSTSEKKIELFAYLHDNGETAKWETIGKISLAEEFKVRIFIDKLDRRAVNVMVNRSISSKDQVFRYVFKNKIPYFKYRLFPYFGGNQVAPNDIKIFIKETY